MIVFVEAILNRLHFTGFEFQQLCLELYTEHEVSILHCYLSQKHFFFTIEILFINAYIIHKSLDYP